jgi:LPPG:FO 2-phospho-L-lactate transferase
VKRVQDPIVVLAGGVGAARFLDGLARVVDPARLFVIGNTADDAEIHGLHVSPDLDTVIYTLAGIADPRRGWGIRGDTFRCLQALGRLGREMWFQLGDGDLATHIYRTERLRQGATLAEVMRDIAKALDVRATVVPMSNSRVRTRVRTRRGELEFQNYFVRRRARDTVLGLRFEGIDTATPAPGVITAISSAAAIILCPSNPFISIGPILALDGVRDGIRRNRARTAAISPIVRGRALKGPAASMMRSLKMDSSAAGVAKLYADLADVFVLDVADKKQAVPVKALGMKPVIVNTIMRGRRERKALARAVVNALGLEV